MKHLYCVLITLCTALPLTASAEQRPNIILVMADDLGFADLGCYGSEIETPNLDALAADGLRFTQFYNTAKCHSSRVSLLTGLYCDQAGGAKLNRGATIGEALSDAGYFTAMVGKWHLSQQPTDFGFDRYWGHLSGATNFFTGDDSFRLNGQPWPVPETLNGRPFYTTHGITDFALEFLDEATGGDKPFLLYTAFNAPHYPLQAPEEAVRKYDGHYDGGWDRLRIQRHRRQLKMGLLPAEWKLSPRPDHIPAWDSLSDEDRQWEADRMEVFAAMVDIVDQSIGRLVAYLKDREIFDNTLILFCSDNGACPFERTRGRDLKPWNPKSYWTYDASWAHAGNTPFRLYKQNQHEGGISSPLIVHWPEGLKAQPGSITNQPGHLIDFMATFIDLADGTYPKQIGDRQIDPLQGKSLLPIFRGETRLGHDTLYFHFGTDRALRQGPWKLVSAKLGKWELYNLDQDRTELNDLAAQQPERVAAMAQRWFQMAEDVDRLSGRALAPVKDTAASLNFRKDTSSDKAKRSRNTGIIPKPILLRSYPAMSNRTTNSTDGATRRDFLKRSAAATATIAAPWIVPASVFGATAPSNRIQMACIGTGNQGIGILRRFIPNDDVQIVAVCDVNTASYGYRSEDQYLGREPACKEVDDHYAAKTGTASYKGCQGYIDFREVLAREDIDAVTVVVPDHWHAIMTIAAAKAGKDIYCEKPLSLTIGQGRAMADAVEKYERVLQTGSMERSNPLNAYICQLVREGRIGDVKRVTTNVGYNNKVGPGPGWKPTPVPEGFDYERWLGPAPDVPYHKDRCLYRFRFHYDYSGGQVTNYGAHSNDLAQWGLGMDDSGPTEIEYVDAKWLPEGSLFNTALETEFRCHYANGVQLTCKTNDKPVGVRFEGTEGMIETTAYPWLARSEPASLIADKYPTGKISFDATTAHVRNFLDCVRSRQKPVAAVEIGHRSASVCHLGNIAIRLGRDVRWDPAQECFPGDEEANAMLLRPMRSPWQL